MERKEFREERKCVNKKIKKEYNDDMGSRNNLENKDEIENNGRYKVEAK